MVSLALMLLNLWILVPQSSLVTSNHINGEIVSCLWSNFLETIRILKFRLFWSCSIS